ncbi:MAG: protoglobin domain-containing protein [Chloroflexota bacterium]
MAEGQTIPGYDFGGRDVERSPVTLEEFQLLRQTVDFDEVDERYLRLAGDVLDDQVDRYLDRWYAFSATLPHLGAFSADAEGKPLVEYRARARARFRQWILDTCRRPFDQHWLDYQHEIGLRHHRTRKNQTDQAAGAPPNISFRYVLAQIYPFTMAARPFLASHGHSADDVERMHQAWCKAVLLQVILWSVPYVKEGDF